MNGSLFKWATVFLGLLCIVLHPGNVFSQSYVDVTPAAYKYTVGSDTGFEKENAGNYYDEVSVTLNVQRIGSLEIQALVYNERLFLPVKELFDFLKIRNILSPDFDRVEGFFIYPKDNYSIDKTNNRITYQNKVFELNASDLIRTENNLYLKSDYFGQVFGLECIFDFRNLAVTLKTKIELPAIREMQQQLMRQNMGQLKGERKADTTIERRFPLFHLGTADWAVSSVQESKGPTDTRANLSIGSLVAGGELNLSLNYFSRQPIQLKQQLYQWHYADNDNKGLRQITAGKLFPQSIASVYAPVIGMQVTNAPTTYRRSFGTYTLSNSTQPGWMVELYINNVLVNYTKADASGFFTFEVPMVYGNSVMKLRFYGPWGEEQMSEKYITVPFNFIPLHQLEYTVTAGVVEDNDNGRFARANLNYGLGRHLTIGGGVEYLSTVASGKVMPFVHASLVVGSHMLIAAEHTYGVSSKTTLNYRFPSDLQFDLSYTRYARGQTAIRVNYLDEKKMVVSMPLKAKKFNAFTRLTLNQVTSPFDGGILFKNKMQYTSGEYLFSSVIAGINSNLTTYVLFADKEKRVMYSNLSVTLRLPAGFRLSPQVQYEYLQERVSQVKCEVEKNIFNRGFINVAYQKEFINNKYSLVTVGLRYNFSFAQTFFSASKNRESVITSQSARGSLIVDSKTNYIGVGNQTAVGKGGIVVLPYLDLNCNERRDPGEPKAYGLKVHINGGRIQPSAADTLIRITALEAYTSYYLELDPTSFDNIAWQLKKRIIKIVIDPNNLKLIEIPVAVVGEVSGTVTFKEGNKLKGLGRIIVNIYNKESGLVAKVVTESDGYFSFVGLAPGEYTARVDSIQLAKLNMESPPVLSFTIVQNREGSIVDNLRFVLQAGRGSYDDKL